MPLKAGTATVSWDILDRNEVLAHPLRQEAFDLSDHVVACDRPVIEFLDNQPRGG